MTREEMRGVWDLLGQYRPGDKRLKDRALMKVWWRTFEPYDAKDLEEAVVSWFRSKRFFPDAKEIAALLPPLPGQGPDATRPVPDVRADLRAREGMDALRQEWLELRALRRAAGVPETVSDALAQGMTVLEWYGELDRLGMAAHPAWLKENGGQTALG